MCGGICVCMRCARKSSIEKKCLCVCLCALCARRECMFARCVRGAEYEKRRRRNGSKQVRGFVRRCVRSRKRIWFKAKMRDNVCERSRDRIRKDLNHGCEIKSEMRVYVCM